MDLSSFWTSLGTSFVFFVIFMLLFTWLSSRPGNAVVYYPNLILKGLYPADGRSSTRNPFAWIQEALSSSEQDVINMSGVDTAVYFVFLSTVLGILAFSGAILLPVLLPVAATDRAIVDSLVNSTSNSTLNATISGAKSMLNSTINATFSELDKLSMGNVKEKSPRLWAFFIATYWVSFVTYYLLWKAYKHVAELRANALMSSKVRPEQFAVLVRDMPNPPTGQSRKQQVDSYFKAIYPEKFYKSLVVTDNRKVNRIWKELEACKRKLAHAEAIYANSKKKKNAEGKGIRPKNKTGFLGFTGKNVDSIDYYNEKINELTSKLKAEQKLTVQQKQQSSALVFFNSRVTAACASQSLHAQMVDNWSVIDAPEPQQLIWNNLKIKFFQRQTRQYVVYLIVFLTISFYLIPISFVSALTTLANLKKLLPFLEPILKFKTIETVLESYLPQFVLYIFMRFLPKFLLFLSKIEGIPSESHAVRAASGKYFYFIVVNVFIGIAIGGTIISTIKRIEKNPNSVVTILAESLPDLATFFLTYVALNIFLGFGLELSRIVPLTIFHLKKKYYCKTEAEIKASWMPGGLSYGKRVPSDMLVITIVLCYSVMAPIIIPFGVLYFGLGWLVLRNQALKVYSPSFESYGRMWPHIHSRVLAALLLFQVTMLGYFGAKKFYYAPLAVPLVIVSLIFAFVCRKKFYPAFRYTALEVVCLELKDTPDMEQIFKSYIPPCLCAENFEDDKRELALSEV
ncbi:hypothetical protein SLE2022_308340 [Rubroshorea leprosula]